MKTWRCLMVALVSVEFSATLLAQTPDKPKRNLLFIGQKMWVEMVQWSMGLIPGDATLRSKPQK